MSTMAVTDDFFAGLPVPENKENPELRSLSVSSIAVSLLSSMLTPVISTLINKLLTAENVSSVIETLKEKLYAFGEKIAAKSSLEWTQDIWEAAVAKVMSSDFISTYGVELMDIIIAAVKELDSSYTDSFVTLLTSVRTILANLDTATEAEVVAAIFALNK